jgi:hypothetical protein
MSKQVLNLAVGFAISTLAGAIELLSLSNARTHQERERETKANLPNLNDESTDVGARWRDIRFKEQIPALRPVLARRRRTTDGTCIFE